jgi:hypothetical protein
VWGFLETGPRPDAASFLQHDGQAEDLDQRVDRGAAAPETPDRVSHLLGRGRPGRQTAIQVLELVDAALEIDPIESAARDQLLHELGFDFRRAATAVTGFLAEHHHGLVADVLDQPVELGRGCGLGAASAGRPPIRMFMRQGTCPRQGHHRDGNDQDCCDVNGYVRT